MRSRTANLVVSSLLLAAGCASPLPADELRESRAALARAERAGAESGAPVELALARRKLELGERWIAAGDYAPARWLVEQARIDADLATLKAEVARTRREAREKVR